MGRVRNVPWQGHLIVTARWNPEVEKWCENLESRFWSIVAVCGGINTTPELTGLHSLRSWVIIVVVVDNSAPLNSGVTYGLQRKCRFRSQNFSWNWSLKYFTVFVVVFNIKDVLTGVHKCGKSKCLIFSSPNPVSVQRFLKRRMSRVW